MCSVLTATGVGSTSETLEEEPKKGITPLEWAASMLLHTTGNYDHSYSTSECVCSYYINV